MSVKSLGQNNIHNFDRIYCVIETPSVARDLDALPIALFGRRPVRHRFFRPNHFTRMLLDRCLHESCLKLKIKIDPYPAANVAGSDFVRLRPNCPPGLARPISGSMPARRPPSMSPIRLKSRRCHRRFMPIPIIIAVPTLNYLPRGQGNIAIYALERRASFTSNFAEQRRIFRDFSGKEILMRRV